MRNEKCKEQDGVLISQLYKLQWMKGKVFGVWTSDIFHSCKLLVGLGNNC